MSILDDLFHTTRNYERSNKKVDKNATVYFKADIIAGKMHSAKERAARQKYYTEAIDYIKEYFGQNGTDKTVPTKIRQLIAYSIYYYNRYEFEPKKSQKELLEELGLRKNMTQKWGMQPLQLLECENYEHPVNPAGYMGVKDGALGKAIRYLEYQAGSYKNFVDLFGGSGTASTAVPYNKSKKYFCNELQTNNYTYLKVLSDKVLFKEFLSAVLEIHSNMISGIVPTEIDYQKVKQLDPCNNKPATLKKYQQIESNGGSDFAVLVYWRLFRNFTLGINYNQMLTENLWSNDIGVALSEFFLQRLAFNGQDRKSLGGIVNDSTRVKQFLGLSDKELKDDFNAYHNRFKHEIVLNYTADYVIANSSTLFGDDNILYYSDSPYLFTKGYGASFGVKEMTELIHGLKNSGQKFIFSCRYLAKREISDDEVLSTAIDVKLKKDTDYDDFYEKVSTFDVINEKKYKIKEKRQLDAFFYNYCLIKHVFKLFEQLYQGKDKKTKLWVCVVSAKASVNTEIMIVNYPVSIETDAYEIYEFDDYMKELFDFYEKNKEFYDFIENYVNI